MAHRYIDGAIATSRGKSGLNWYGAAWQMGLGKTGILPSLNIRTGLAPIPVTLGPRSDGFEKINEAQKIGLVSGLAVSHARDNKFSFWKQSPYHLSDCHETT